MKRRAVDPVLITVPQVAELLGTTPRAVYSMVSHQVFPDGIVVRVGRAIVFLRPRLEEWAGLHRNGTAPELEGLSK